MFSSFNLQHALNRPFIIGSWWPASHKVFTASNLMMGECWNSLWKQIMRVYASQFTRCTFLAAKNCIPLHICKAADTRLVIVKISSLEKSSLHQVGWNISLLLRRNSSRLPCGQYSIIMYSLGYFVQAPKTFTMFTCSPTWIIIFNSPAKLRMSFTLGFSKNEEKISQWVHFVA